MRLSQATTKGTSSCLLRPMMVLLMKASLSFTSFIFMLSFVSLTYNFLLSESTSFLRFCISIQKPILLFFYQARCRFLRMSIQFYSRLYLIYCYSILLFKAKISSILKDSYIFSLEFYQICALRSCWKSAFILGSEAGVGPLRISLDIYSSFSREIILFSRLLSLAWCLVNISAYFSYDSLSSSILHTFFSFSQRLLILNYFSCSRIDISLNFYQRRAIYCSFFLKFWEQVAIYVFSASKNSSDLRLFSSYFTWISNFFSFSFSLLLISLISSSKSSMRCLERYSFNQNFSNSLAKSSSFPFNSFSNTSTFFLISSFSLTFALKSFSAF